MTRSVAKASTICQICGLKDIVRRLPQEIDRKLIQIETPPSPEPHSVTQKISILRITYQREFICTGCGHIWQETFITEKQKTV